MAEKQVKKKEVLEFKNSTEILATNLKDLPNILFYVSEDSLEFDLVATHYKDLFKKIGEQYETITIVPEDEDVSKLFTELFNFSMFSSWKLILIRGGSDFFKPFLKVEKKDMYDNFKRNITGISEKIFVVIHMDSKELSSKIATLFDNKYGLLKNRNFWPDDRKKALDVLCRAEKIIFDADAIEEFIHRVPPNTGSYHRSITKLKTLLHKKHFTSKEVVDILFPTNEFNPFQLAEYIFQKNKLEFYKEFSKLNRDGENHTKGVLSFLTSMLARTDEVRKAKILFERYKNDDTEIFKHLGMATYSEGRKRFIKQRLRKETTLFSDKALTFLYDFLINLNIREKSSQMKTIDVEGLYFQSNIEKLFTILNEDN
jgi:DNA polymerase-3 subunit delta